MSPSLPDAARSALRELWQEEDRIMCAYPELAVRIYAAADGMHIRAVVYLPGPKFSRKWIEVARAVWQPREVTEVSVVDWGRRALSKWLEDQLTAIEE